jgi:uncharacterized protein (DUF885 family)
VPFAAYEPPPIFLGAQTGRFYVTPPDAAATGEALQAASFGDTASTPFPAMVAHEAYPGHHLQLTTAQGTDLRGTPASLDAGHGRGMGALL